MNVLQKYFRYRQGLIDQYIKGDMTKREYLEKNYDAVTGLDVGPFNNIDSVDKGLFNYHYYNAMAKWHKRVGIVGEYGEFGDYGELSRERIEEVNFYYRQKDRATTAILRLIDYKGVKAYFINVRSKYLRGKLYEMVIDEHEVILHSASLRILKELQQENVFEEGVRTSLIDGYVNQKY